MTHNICPSTAHERWRHKYRLKTGPVRSATTLAISKISPLIRHVIHISTEITEISWNEYNGVRAQELVHGLLLNGTCRSLHTHNKHLWNLSSEMWNMQSALTTHHQTAPNLFAHRIDSESQSCFHHISSDVGRRTPHGSCKRGKHKWQNTCLSGNRGEKKVGGEPSVFPMSRLAAY